LLVAAKIGIFASEAEELEGLIEDSRVAREGLFGEDGDGLGLELTPGGFEGLPVAEEAEGFAEAVIDGINGGDVGIDLFAQGVEGIALGLVAVEDGVGGVAVLEEVFEGGTEGDDVVEAIEFFAAMNDLALAGVDEEDHQGEDGQSKQACNKE
jgi:hypothetical protein